MENIRIFDDHVNLTFDNVKTKVNEAIKSQTQTMVNPWIDVPESSLKTEEAKKRFEELAVYIDGLMISVLDKLDMINTLSILVSKTGFAIDTYDVDGLYVVTDYFNEVEEKEFAKQIKVVGDKQILLIVRYNVLEPLKRVKLLEWMMNEANTRGLDFNNDAAVEEFNKEMTEVVRTRKADDILGLESYMGINEKKDVRWM